MSVKLVKTDALTTCPYCGKTEFVRVGISWVCFECGTYLFKDFSKEKGK